MNTKAPSNLREWFVINEPGDGSAVLEIPRADRRRDAIGNVLVLCFLLGLAYYLVKSVHLKFTTLSDPATWIALAGGLYALVLVYTIVFEVYGREQWIANANSLLWRRELFGHTREKRYTNGKLVLGYIVRDKGIIPSSTVTICAPGRWRKRLYLNSDRSVIEDLANFLAERLGWPVE